MLPSGNGRQYGEWILLYSYESFIHLSEFVSVIPSKRLMSKFDIVKSMSAESGNWKTYSCF